MRIKTVVSNVRLPGVNGVRKKQFSFNYGRKLQEVWLINLSVSSFKVICKVDHILLLFSRKCKQINQNND